MTERRTEPALTAAEVMAWETELGRFRPDRPTAEEALKAHQVVSYNFQAGDDGLFLRLRTTGGQADFFLNAAVACQLATTIADVGALGCWRNMDDGSVILRDPEKAGYRGPVS